MSEESADIAYSLRLRYQRFTTLLDKSDCDLPTVLNDLEADFDSLSQSESAFLLNKYLPAIVKALLDKRYIAFQQSQVRVQTFFKGTIRLVIRRMDAGTPGALEVIRRLLNDEKDYYDYKFTSVGTELITSLFEGLERDKAEADQEVLKDFGDFVPLQANAMVNILYPYTLNYFGINGGFNALLRLIRTHPPLDQVNSVLFILTQVQNYLHSQVWRSLVQRFISASMDFVLKATDEDLRNYSKESLKIVVDYMDSLESDVHLSEHGANIEAFELEAGLKFLLSPYLDKRIYGLTNIIHVIERSQREEHSDKRHPPARRVVINPVHGDIEMTTLKPAHYQRRWLQSADLLAWCDQHDLISLIFGDKSHSELIRRSSEVLKFLYTHSRCTREDLDRIWTTALSKHETERDVTVSLYREIVPVLLPEDSEYFFHRVTTIPVSQVDTQVLSLIVTFVKPAKAKKRGTLKITIPQPAPEELAEPKVADPNQPIALGYYPEETQTQEAEMEPDTEPMRLEPKASAALEILWNWSQQPSGASGMKKEVAQEALKQFQELLRTVAKAERWKYLEKCLFNLRSNIHPVSMCEVLQHLISSYSSYHDSDLTRAQLISQLDRDCHLFTELYANIVWLKRESAQRLLDTMQREGAGEDDERTDTQSSSSADSGDVRQYSEALLGLKVDPDSDYSYYEEVKKRLELLKFLYQNSPETLSPRYFLLLWNCFALNAFSQREQDDFFTWFSSLISGWSGEYCVLDDETIHTVFTDILLRLDSKTLTSAAFECFEQYFLHVNKMHGLVVKMEFEEEYEVKDIALLGVDALWEHILQVRSDKVSAQAALLLKKLYRGLSSADASVQADLMIRCMYHVKVGTERLREGLESESVIRINRALGLLSDFIDEFEGANDAGPSVHLTVQNTAQHAKEPKIFSIKLPLSMKFHEAREVIASRLTPAHQGSEIIILHSGNSLDGRKKNRTLKELKLLDGHKLIVCDAVDPYGYVSTQSQTEEGPLDSTKVEQISQLKAICEKREEIVVAALKRTLWNMEDAVELLTNEDILADLEKEVKTAEKPAKAPTNSRLSEVLSDNHDYFDLLFQLLSLGNSTVSGQVWRLLTQIPINKDLYESLRTFSEGWEDLLDANCLYKLLYSLKIIHSLLEHTAEAETQSQWKGSFIENGGFTRLYDILMTASHISLFSGEQQSNNAKCLGFLLSVIRAFLKAALDGTDPHAFPEVLSELIVSVVDWRKATAKLADLIEDLSQTPLESETVYVVENALGLILQMGMHQPEALTEVYAREGLLRAIGRALVSPSEKLRKAYMETITAISVGLQDDARVSFEPPASFFLKTLLDVLPVEPNSGTDFFDLVAQLIALQRYFDPSLLEKLIEMMATRDILEDRRVQNQDSALGGVVTVVQALFEVRPEAIDSFPDLADCIYASLFDSPKSSEMNMPAIPPKFKHADTRKRGFSLLLCLSRISPPTTADLLLKLHKTHFETNYRSIYDSAIPIKSSTGFVGLKNLGSTCYMNSLLQQLFLMPDFREGILSADLAAVENLEENVLYQLQLIFANLKLSEKQHFPPRGLVKALRDLEGQALNPSIQQDVDEFFSLLCDRLEISMKGTRQEKLLRNLIGGTVVNIIESKESEYQYVSEREEQFLRLSLEIKNKKTLSEALDLYIKEDALEGDNKYFCEQFDRKVNATRRVLLDSLQNTVIIHLKRFEFDYTTSQRVKINDYCEFPSELNLKPWARDRNREEWYYVYRLVGVLVHTGIAEAGHYYSYIADRETCKWYEFNDQTVKEFRTENIKEECFGGTGTMKTYWGTQSYTRSGNAYLLVYERVRKCPLPEAEAPLTAGHNLSREIQNQVLCDNIDFLRDGQLFDLSYHRFLLAFVRQHQFPARLDYESHMSTGKDRSVVHWEEEPDDREVESDAGLKLIQTAVHYALELLLRAKLTDFFKEWVELIATSLLRRHNAAAFWLIQKLTPTKHEASIVPIVLLEERQAETRTLFAELIVQAIAQTLQCEKHIFGQSVQVRVLHESSSGRKYTDESRQKAASARFLQYYMTGALNDARLNWRRFNDYFKSLDRLFRLSPEVLRFSQAEHFPENLLEFFMNGSSPFVLDERLVMGDHMDTLDMELPVELLVLLITKSCMSGAPRDDCVQMSPTMEKHLNDYRVFRALVAHPRPDPVQRLLAHMCLHNRDYSFFAIGELLTLVHSYRAKWSPLAHILRYITSLLTLEDEFEYDRTRKVLTTPVSRMSTQYIVNNNLLDVLYRFKDTHYMFTALVILWFGDMLAKEKFRTMAMGFRTQFVWMEDYLRYFDSYNLTIATVEDYRGTTIHIPTALQRVREVISVLQATGKSDSSEGTEEG